MTSPAAPSGQSPPGRSTLYGQIVGGAFAIPLALLLVFAATNYFQTRTTTVNDSLKALSALASVQESRVESYVSSGSTHLQLIASRSRLREALVEYQGTASPSLRAEMESILQAAINSTPDVASVTLYDQAGHFVLYAGDSEERLIVPSSVAREARDRFTAGVVVPIQDARPVHLVGGPILLDGEVIGSAVLAQSVEPLFELTADWTGLGETGETILARNLLQDAQFIAPLRFDPDAALNRIESGRLRNLPMITALEGVETQIRDGVDYRGEPVYSVTRHVDSTGWGLVVKKDVAEVLAPVRANARFTTIALIVGLALALLAARRVARTISAPIGQLAANARSIVGGRRDLSVETDLEEVEELAEAFRMAIVEVDTLTSNLEDKIEERTWQLMEKNEKLREVMEGKELFLAGVSHELRSPLTAMIGFIDLVVASGEDLDEAQRGEMLATISAQAEDVLNMIEDLLASARVEAGTLKVASVRVDLAAQARQVIESTQPGSRTEIVFEGGEAVATGDPARVRQVVRNLISNAMRYGGPDMGVSVHERLGSSVIEVKDNGDGIPMVDRDSVFDAYGQSDATRKVAESVGLGLSVSRELARLMDGDLTYDFQEGSSVFALSLPPFVDSDLDADAGTSLVGAHVPT